MLYAPIYDSHKTYEQNYKKGPFGKFAKKSGLKRRGNPKYEFLGQKVYLPFGTPAGMLLNSNFVKAAFNWGFDVSVYKTVRSGKFKGHPFPNILFVNTPKELYPDEILRLHATNQTGKNNTEFNITNSFGVPSRDPTIWQEDVKKAISYAGKGQVMILSFMGTVKPDQTQKEFVRDFALTARLAYETGAKILEVNLSCPNIGNEGLVCFNIEATKQICKAIRKQIKDTPLILKVGYYQNKHSLEELAEIADCYADAISAINSLQADIVDKNGNQALPGDKTRLKSGVCGSSIKWAGVETIRGLNRIRRKSKYKYNLIGVGGVMTPKDYIEYRDAGADAVMSATGAMWNPYLAQEIKKLF